VAWQRASDGSYSCDECGDAFPAGRSCSCPIAAGSPPGVATAADPTSAPGDEGGEPAGVFSVEQCRVRFARNAKAVKAVFNRAQKLEREACDADEETLKRITVRNATLNVQINALKCELPALRAAAEYALEAEKLRVKKLLVEESRAQRAADAEAMH